MAATPQVVSDAAKPPRPRNELWDAVAHEFFGGTVTSVHEGQVAKVVKDLRTLGATPATIKRRIKNYRLHMPNAICTPTALVKHWPLCANEPLQPGQAPPRTDEEWDRLITEAWEQDNGPDLVRRAKEQAAREQAAKDKGESL